MNKLLVAVLVIALSAAYCFLGLDYAKQNREQARLKSEIADAEQALAQVPLPPQGLEEQLAAAQASLAAEQMAIPGEINSNQLIDTILNLAKEHGVQAIPLVTQPWSTANVGGYAYRVFRINVEVEGSFAQLNNFISSLENVEFETLLVEHLRIIGISEGLEEETASGERFTASLDLAVFAGSLDYH